MHNSSISIIMNRKNDINKLLKKCEEHYETYKYKKYIIEPSIPILFFGDIDEYFSSKIKIVTAATNPSDREFKSNLNSDLSFFRFPQQKLNDNNYTALKNYFKEYAYDWFDKSFEPILNGIKSSYYSNTGFSNRAIHTDICSPLATTKKWSKLNNNEANQLKKVGQEIWKELIGIMQPDILLTSVQKSIKVQMLGVSGTLFWDSKSNAERNNHEDLRENNEPRIQPYKVYINDYLLKSGKKTKVIYGRGNQYPFMDLDFSSIRKPRVKLGEYIFENLDLSMQ